MRSSILFLYAIVLAGVFSCSEEAYVEIPGDIHAASPRRQLGYANRISADPVAVQVLNTKDLPMANVAVRFTLTKGEATLQSETMLTDANGAAFTFVTFRENSPEVIVQASIVELEAVVVFNFDVSRSAASKIEVISGNHQEAAHGTTLPEPLAVRVTDDFGNAAKNFPVEFTVIDGDGELSRDIVATDEEGEASASLRISDTNIVNQVVAEIPGASVTFEAAGVMPVVLNAPVRSTGIVTLHWQKSVNDSFENYHIFRAYAHSPSAFGLLATIGNRDLVLYKDTDVFQGETYTYKVVVETIRGTQVSGNQESIFFGDRVALDGWADDFQVDEVRNRIYVSMTAENKIYVVDIATNKIVDKILVGSLPRGVALSKDNQLLYVALSGSGDVAIVDLTTQAVEVIDVESAVGTKSVYYVIEAAPNRVFVTGHTGTGASTYLTMVKTDEGKVIRVSDENMRDQSTLSVDYGKFLYVNTTSRLHKVDLSKEDAPIVLSRDVPGVLSYHLLSPDGKKIFVRTGRQLNTANFTLEHTYDNSASYATDATGAVLYSADGLYITGHNTTSYERVTFLRVDYNEPVRLKVSGDGKTFYVLSRDIDDFWMYIIQNN